jgi:hypothetical protein
MMTTRLFDSVDAFIQTRCARENIGTKNGTKTAKGGHFAVMTNL